MPARSWGGAGRRRGVRPCADAGAWPHERRMRSMTSSETLLVGVIQMCSSCDIGRNIRDASALICEAHAQGAKFIATPEMTNILDTDRTRVAASVGEEGTDAAVRRFSDVAQELGVHLLIGSMALRS